MEHNTHNNTGERPQRPPYDQDARGKAPVPSGGSQVYRRPPARQSAAPKAPPEPQRQKSSGYSSGSAAAHASRRPAARKTRRKRRRWPFVLLSVVMVLVVGIAVMYQAVASEISGATTEAGELPQEVKTLPEWTGKGIVNFLVCGLDYDEVNGYKDSSNKIGNTDMIMYVHYDTVTGDVSILQIPRDTFVGSEVATGGTGKINGLYQNAADKNNRMAALANVIYDQFKLPIDFYVTIDMDSVKEIIDIVGTIRVYVPVEVSDPDHPDSVIPVGWRDFTSAEAEFFLRNRKSPTYQQQGDIMRLQMQQSFYSALFREFKSLQPGDLLMWMRVLLYRVNTDMDPLKLGGLAQKALSIQSENITFVRPACGQSFYQAPGSSTVQSLITLDKEDTARLLNEYFRPEGEDVPASELKIQELPRDQGTVPAQVKTMQDIRNSEGEEPA